MLAVTLFFLMMKQLLFGMMLAVLMGACAAWEKPPRPLAPIAAKLEPTWKVVYKTVGQRSPMNARRSSPKPKPRQKREM
jgi:hypothetical protein